MIKCIHHFFYALLFLTKLPAPPLPKATQKDWGRITPYFVLIGFIIGFVLFFTAKVLHCFQIPIMFSSMVIVFVWCLITGGLHLDGLMDTFDGVGCQDKEKKLTAMKDSRVGAFGAMAGIFIILFKLVSLCTILMNKFFIVLIISPAIARLMAVYSLSYSGKNDLSGISSKLITDGIKKPQDLIINIVVFVSGILFIMSFFLVLGYQQSVISHELLVVSLFILFSILCFLLWSRWLDNHFKGHSGDTYGALIELSEASLLSLVVLFKNLLS